ncbi:MAG: glycosyl transferase [Nitrospinae bacterium RIFCSPLOWO2_02_39_17]|nr:MAG: glycosyl transferase [Nitrospinae bacterium RIFCSPHIGHO2_02_FULL_39_82]OGW01713.1 MAG: glycosyl transferase [Nitrospinae bacterium RIFCSPLOWO2_02_39_17]
MKVDLMRKVDFYIGVPLCFFFSILFRIISLLKACRDKFIFLRKGNIQPKNILFIELSEMGSAILVDPAMKKLQRSLIGSELFFLIFKRNKPSLNLLNTIKEENIFTISEDSFLSLTFDTLRFLMWARVRNIDTVIDLELFSRFTALLTILSGAGNCVGFYGYHNEGLYRGDFLTHRVSYNPHIHIAKNFISLINALLSNKLEVPYSKTLITDEEIRLDKVTIEDKQKIEMINKIEKLCPMFSRDKNRIVLINPNASEMLIQRRWNLKNFSLLIQYILNDYPDVVVLITGSAGEREEAEKLRLSVKNNRCYNFAGESKFHELPALYSVAHCMVTNDSGPGHFSAVLDMPTFVLYGPETPKLYGSLGNSKAIYAALACSPCVSAANHRKTSCTDNVCLKIISPEYVYGVIKPCLNSKGILDLRQLRDMGIERG